MAKDLDIGMPEFLVPMEKELPDGKYKGRMSGYTLKFQFEGQDVFCRTKKVDRRNSTISIFDEPK
jgi:hypothetical protein